MLLHRRQHRRLTLAPGSCHATLRPETALASRDIARTVTPSGYPRAMRETIKAFRRFTGACGAGVYLGMFACGLLAVLRGDAVAGVLTGAPVLILMGAAGGYIVARRTRRTLFPALPHRTAVFTAAIGLALPIALCFPQARIDDDLKGAILLLPGVITAAVHLARERARARRAQMAMADLYISVHQRRLVGARDARIG